jgi:hypothetical protein
MMTITAFIERHPVPAYFALTFARSWGAVLLVSGPGGAALTFRLPAATRAAT